MQYVTPPFMSTTPSDRTVLDLATDVQLGNLPKKVKVKAECLTAQYFTTPTVAYLDEALAKTGPGTARLLYEIATSDTVAVAKVTIAPLLLVHPLLKSNLLTPVNAWNLVATREESLGMENRVEPLLHCIRDHMNLTW